MATGESLGSNDPMSAERRIRLLEEENSRLRQKLSSTAGAPSGWDSERFLHRILDAIPVSVTYLDRNLIYRQCNAAAALALGRPVEEILGRHLHEVVPDNPDLWERVEKVLETGEAFPLPTITVNWSDRPELGSRYFLVSYRPDFDSRGQVIGVFAEGQDITEVIKAREIEAERTRLRAVIDTLPVGIFIIDAQGRILEINDAVKEIWGGAPLLTEVGEYGNYRGWWADSGKPLAAQEWAAARAVLKGEASHNEEIHILGFDGRQRTIMNSATPLRDADGRISGAIVAIKDITEKRQAEEALHDSEARFRATFEQAAVGICHVSIDGSFLRVNRKLTEIFGYPPESLMKQSFQEITHPDDLDRDLEQFERLISGEITTYSMEKRYIRGDGSTIWGKLTVSVLRDRRGKPAYCIAVVEDISEKKRTEEALARSESFYKGLFTNHHAVMLLIDPETGRFHDANPAACVFYGYSRSEMLQKHIYEINIETRDALLRKMERARTREEQSFVFMHRLASGEIRHVEVHSGPVEREGKPFLVSIVCDITDRFHAERERESLLSELNATITSMAEGVVVYSPEGDIVRLNPAAERILGLSPEELSLPHDERLKRLRVKDENGREISAEESPFSITRTGGELKGKVLIFPSSAGKEIRVSTSAAPICDEQGEMLGIVCTLTDITELHQLQEQNQTFLHMVSHDLRTPLTVVHGYAELLQMELQESSAAHLLQGAGAIIQCADQMNSMISQMLDMAQLESGSVTLEKEPVLLCGFTEGLLRRSASVLEVGRIDVQIGEIPPVDADPRVLERILINLVTNALKYSPADSPVVISATMSGDEVVLSVQDRGEGIDSADIPHLFSQYFRTRGATKKEGLGLGLYITRMMTEAHGGRISVESRKGEGSTFRISLPRPMEGHYGKGLLSQDSQFYPFRGEGGSPAGG